MPGFSIRSATSVDANNPVDESCFPTSDRTLVPGGGGGGGGGGGAAAASTFPIFP